MVDVDLSKLYVKPCKEVKKEIKRNKKRAQKDGEDSDEEDPKEGGPTKNPIDEESKGFSTPQVIDVDSVALNTKLQSQVKKPDGFMQRALAHVAGKSRPSEQL